MSIRDLANYITWRLMRARKFLWWWIIPNKEYWEISDIAMQVLLDDEAAQQSVQPTDGGLAQSDGESNPPTISG